jgi:hypothetical protein
MARDILSEFGPESKERGMAVVNLPQTPHAKPIPYDPPKGPMGIGHEGPGLGGNNHGNCGTQGKR